MKLKNPKNAGTLSVNREKCIGCGRCIEVCPHNVFHMKEKKSEIINKHSCMKCEACKNNCPVSAIDVHADTGGFVYAVREMMYKDKPITDTKQTTKIRNEYWITGFKETGTGKIPVITTKLNKKEILDNIIARMIIFGGNYRIEPGLYCVGNPDENSPVLVTANYKLTFDTVRKELVNIQCWILILDTKGINVWCAAAMGKFSTAEIVKKVKTVNLKNIVKHNTLILPQLGAPGVSAHLVKKQSGFNVVYGPAMAKYIELFLNNNYKKDKKMRTVTYI